MKIVFMGTPDFGAVILKGLLKEHEIVLVVTQPDKLVGRKQQVEFSPVKQIALKYDLNLFQPNSIKKEYKEILKYDFDLIVTAAFGQIINKELLEYPRYKAINVHGSLLPKYRGGAPIQRSIINGEEYTGITIMYMASKMDAGDIIEQVKLPIEDNDNSDTMFDKLAILGRNLVLKVINDLESGCVLAVPQDELLVTYAPNLTKADELIDFSKPAREVYNHIRGLASNPGAYFKIKDITFKVYSSAVAHEMHEAEIGEIIEVEKSSFTVQCGKFTAITFTEIKPEGRNLMTVKDYLNGKGKEVILKGEMIQ